MSSLHHPLSFLLWWALQWTGHPSSLPVSDRHQISPTLGAPKVGRVWGLPEASKMISACVSLQTKRRTLLVKCHWLRTSSYEWYWWRDTPSWETWASDCRWFPGLSHAIWGEVSPIILLGPVNTSQILLHWSWGLHPQHSTLHRTIMGRKCILFSLLRESFPEMFFFWASSWATPTLNQSQESITAEPFFTLFGGPWSPNGSGLRRAMVWG